MTCGRVIRFLPGYLDGALPESLGSEGHASIGAHLETCSSCRRELERYRRIQRMMSVAERPSPPTDLGSRILIAVSNARAFGGFAGRLRRGTGRLEILLWDIFLPLALPSPRGAVRGFFGFVLGVSEFVTRTSLCAAPTPSPETLV